MSKKRKLRPEAKVALSVMVGGVIIAGTVYVSRKNTPEPIVEANVVFETLAEETNIDSDNDGLLDWEEVMWKSDPDIADTDGDNTSDGDEIAIGRNPLEAGPDDDLPPSNTFSNAALPDPEAEINATEQIAVTVASRYQVSRDLNGFSEETISKIIEDLPSFYSNLQTVRPLTKKELNIVSSVTDGAFKKYSEALKATHTKASEGNPGENEFVIMAEAMEDPSAILKLDPIIKGYEVMIEDFSNMEVPSLVVEKHLQYTNASKNMLQVIKAMRKLEEDPLLAYVGAAIYLERVDRFAETFLGLAEFLKEQGITQ